MQLSGDFYIKLGKSFLNRDPKPYVAVRCDFMPASVDRSQPGSLRVNEGNEVVVNMPNVTSTGVDTTTTFRGTARSVQKECMLVYNKKTHELTLERVGHIVQLKKTREERKPDTPCPPNSEGSQFLSVSNRSDQETNLKSVRPTPPKRKSNDSEISATSNTTAQQSSQKKTHSRTLSSSSSSSVSSSSSSSCDMDVESSDSDDSVSDSDSSSTLSSLSSGRNKSVINKPPHPNAKSDAKVVNSNLAAHRKLIEHDLKLSDSDSDCSD